jgi:hypothetical protein
MSRRLFALEALILGPLSIFSFFQLLANVFSRWTLQMNLQLRVQINLQIQYYTNQSINQRDEPFYETFFYAFCLPFYLFKLQLRR